VVAKIAARLKQCGLELHPEKTKIAYCKDANRQETHSNEKFDFLGFTFRPRKAYGRRGKVFCSFSPAISNDAPRGAIPRGYLTQALKNFHDGRTNELNQLRGINGWDFSVSF